MCEYCSDSKWLAKLKSKYCCELRYCPACGTPIEITMFLSSCKRVIKKELEEISAVRDENGKKMHFEVTPDVKDLMQRDFGTIGGIDLDKIDISRELEILSIKED